MFTDEEGSTSEGEAEAAAVLAVMLQKKKKLSGAEHSQMIRKQEIR